MRKHLLPAIALLVLVTALPVMAAEEEDTPTSILKSAGVQGGEAAAKLLAETAGVDRFASEARFARHAGVAPVPISSGRRQRHLRCAC